MLRFVAGTVHRHNNKTLLFKPERVTTQHQVEQGEKYVTRCEITVAMVAGSSSHEENTHHFNCATDVYRCITIILK